MIELLLNRHDGYTFKRWAEYNDHGPVRDEPGTPDRPDVRLVLTPLQVNLFRSVLKRLSERYQNPEVILFMLGDETSDEYEQPAT